MSGAYLHPILYEINTRVWLRELRHSHGVDMTLGTVPEGELEYWTRLGFTHIWLMGVWTTGPKTRQLARAQPWLRARLNELLPEADETELGSSPYAIQQYRVAADLGGNKALEQFRRRLNARGIALVLDYVPNHVGIDHPWVMSHPDRFVEAPEPRPGYVTVQTATGIRHLAHGRDPYFPPWTDTFQLNYRMSETRQAMSRELQRVAGFCDAVRCDMAMLVLADVFQKTWGGQSGQEEFWPEAIAAAKRANPGICLVAEAYWGLEERLRDLGFDYTYDKELYDHVFAGCAEKVYQHLSSEPSLARGVHFLENHDEQRVAKRLSPLKHRAAAVLMLSLPGMRLLHQGQLTGATEHIPVQFLSAPAESNPTVCDFYEHLLHVLKDSVIGRDKWQIETPSNSSQTLVITWTQDKRKTLVAVNLSNQLTECLLPRPVAESRLVDLISRMSMPTRVAEGGVVIQIPPGTTFVLELNAT